MSAAHASVPPLRIEGLNVSYDGRAVVQGVDFAVRPGEVVALVGESGSGKTTTAQALIGLLPANGRVESGRVLLGGEDVSGWSDRRLSALRGRVVSLIPQDPGSSLDPVQTIGTQLGEVFRLHGHRDRRTIRAEVLDLLRRVGLSEPELRFAQYPHELSGGMKQRVLIAIALALKPRLVIADEPTSALDVTVQRRILDLIDELRREHGTAVLLVTHDLAVAADRADRIVVMRGGRIVEQGDASTLLSAPRESYTQRLLSDAPAFAAPARQTTAPIDAPPIIEVEGLVQDFPAGRGRSRAVDGIGFRIASGTTHALVGESGSGKTTTGRAVLGLLQPTAGRVTVAGQDVAKLKGAALRSYRRTIQLVYQNPFASLDPRQSVREIVEEPLLNFEPVSREERRSRVSAILERVHLPADLAERRPAALSGGQRQRVAIARALILQPRVLVLDEAVSALDVTVQAQILHLLDELQRELGLTYLFISHDLAVVRAIADTVSVLRAGKVVEEGCVEDVFARPSAAYTRELVDAIPGRPRPTSFHEVAST
ncbi:dipeptide ABC transporter ATP-binding protein [Aureimonas jatrophae]|uniref:Peptide/nickel transport system ATP-binding protein/peptide/nickel transport system permease protein n=1 Tax=Aureimonas jatrophae TaxID=1166073 RepID=A0A1H0ML07_9HYPH|nr:ABC transporter ATP-binding protein [Aureimonas jatrophae]MBB3952903.1 peptide/nickel transport system ATP-binding protein/peptide/nickel transport system permease protein [Aureimonas jatrophae]SDO81139.1 peptide/nickel transport system ATP-binding protein/peptide/nickel transport system permease protein [Aureimonas jatrophae]